METEFKPTLYLTAAVLFAASAIASFLVVPRSKMSVPDFIGGLALAALTIYLRKQAQDRSKL